MQFTAIPSPVRLQPVASAANRLLAFGSRHCGTLRHCGQSPHRRVRCQFESLGSQSLVRASRGSAAPGSQFVTVAAKGVNRGSVCAGRRVPLFSRQSPKSVPSRNARAGRKFGYAHARLSIRRSVEQVRSKLLQAHSLCRFAQVQSQSQPNHSFKRTSHGVPWAAA